MNTPRDREACSEHQESGGGQGKPSRRGFRLLFWGILVLAVLLRLWSLDHGLPYSYYADEDHFVKRAVALGSGDLNPHWFHKPAFLMYLLFVEYGLYYLVGNVAGWWGSSTEFAHHFFDDASMFYLLGRLTATLSGIAVVVLGILCGRRLGGPACGCLTGFILATNFCLAEAGRWVKADVPCALFTLCAVYGLIRIMEEGRRKHYWLAGAAIGLGMATKYYALTLVLSLWMVHWLRPALVGRRRRLCFDRRPWEAMGFFLVVFFLCSPFNIIDFGNWWHLNLGPRIHQILHEKIGISLLSFAMASPQGVLAGVWGLFRCLLGSDCMGLIWGTLGVAGLCFQVFRGPRAAWVPMLALVPFIIVAVLWNPIDFEPRYLSAILPLLAMAAAHGITAAWIGLRRRAPKIPTWIGVVLVLGAGVPGVLDILDWNQRHGRKDTRTLAAEWIETHIPAGARIINDNDWVKLRKNVESLELELGILEVQRARGRDGAFLTKTRDVQYEYAIAASRKAGAEGKSTYHVYTLNHPWWSQEEDPEGDSGRHEWDRDMGTPWIRRPPVLEEMAWWGVEYIVTTAKTYCDYRPGERFGHKKNWARFYRCIEQLPLVYTIPYQPDVRPGPTVRVYAVDRESLRRIKAWRDRR